MPGDVITYMPLALVSFMALCIIVPALLLSRW